MKHCLYRKLLLKYILFLLVFFPLSGISKDSMKGYEFWLGFFKNNITVENNDLFVIITAEEFSTGKVSIPRMGWEQEFSLNAGSSYSVKIPLHLGNHDKSGQIENKGIKITSSSKVNVFAINSSQYTTDGSYILPKQNLYNDYWVVSYPGFSNTPNDLLIIATEDNTEIEITPRVETENGHQPEVPFTIGLQAGQSYLLRSAKGTDITGSRVRGIENCKSFAVFSGAKGAHVPSDCSAVDHIFHQMLPARNFGSDYLLSPINNDYSCRILATENNTLVKINGQAVTTLQKGEYHDLHHQKKAVWINASQPVAVAQFLQGTGCSAMGDPGMAMVPALDGFYKKAQFIVPVIGNIEKNLVHIITKTNFGNNLRINGDLWVNGLTAIPQMPGFGYCQVPLATGPHVIEADSGLVAMVYGTGWANSYLFSAGFREEFQLEVKIDKELCIGTPANFNCTADNASSWSWDFGDNTSESGKNVSHQYQNAGTYEVLLTINKMGECPIVFKDFVKVAPYPILDLPKESSACGDYDIILSAKEKGLVYKWSTGETTQVIHARASGLYYLDASNGICNASDSVLVTRTPYPHPVEISSDTTIYINNSASLNASGGNTYQWEPPYGLGCKDCPATLASPKQSTTYYVRVYDNTGCMALDSVRVNVDEDVRVFVPNIFSPNNDGQNDILYARGKGIKSISFMVFNRWGEKVFESNSPDYGWDGTFRGSPLGPSVFVFYLDAIMESGERIVRNGDVTLVK